MGDVTLGELMAQQASLAQLRAKAKKAKRMLRKAGRRLDRLEAHNRAAQEALIASVVERLEDLEAPG